MLIFVMLLSSPVQSALSTKFSCLFFTIPSLCIWPNSHSVKLHPHVCNCRQQNWVWEGNENEFGVEKKSKLPSSPKERQITLLFGIALVLFVGQSEALHVVFIYLFIYFCICFCLPGRDMCEHFSLCVPTRPPCALFCSVLWSTGPPLHCSSASSSPVESPFPPPSKAASESQGRLLGNSVAQPAQDSESEDEFGPNSFLVKTGSGTLYAPAAAATADGEFGLQLLLMATKGSALLHAARLCCLCSAWELA